MIAVGKRNDIQLYRKLLEMTGRRSTLEHRPLPEDDPKTRQPDITRAREVLGWEPLVPLREGLEKTIPYFRRLVEEEGATARVM